MIPKIVVFALYLVKIVFWNRLDQQKRKAEDGQLSDGLFLVVGRTESFQGPLLRKAAGILRRLQVFKNGKSWQASSSSFLIFD